ncbi:MAG TPA: ABC transporter permease [Conexibacter sp.]|jgi:ribose transport system permease protein
MAIAVPVRGAHSSPNVRKLLRTYSFGFALVLALALLIANLLTQSSFGWTEQLATFAPLAIGAMASTPSIISGRGGFDLTISPLMTFISILFVSWLVPAGLGGYVAIPILLAIGAACGAINGLIIVGLRVPPMVVTLSTYFIFIGIDLKTTPTPVTLQGNWISDFGGSVGPIPGALFTILLPLAIWGLLGLVPYKRILYAVGSNDATAFSSGVNVSAVRVGAYALGGLFAAIGGFAITALVSSADAGTASSYTLVAVAAVALGGTSLAGGRGGVLGSLIGAACIYLLQSLLNAVQINSTWLQVMYGVMLLIAVVFGAALTRAQKEAR